MANDAKDDTNTINQKSFVQTTKGYILSASNPLAAETNIDRRNKILKNYWVAITDLLVTPDSPNQSVIFKTIGLELFNIISTTIFIRLYNEKNFTVARIKELLQHGFENLPNEYLAIQNPEWWESGGGASNINKAAVRHIATELNRAMNVQKSTDNIQL